METRNRCWRFGVTCCVWTAVGCWLVAAEFQLGENLKPADPVESITVQLEIGNDGEDLDEPVALDLGLGFPLWLHPLGREEADAVPFGALPQESSVGRKLAAGSSATFRFALGSEAGADSFRSSSQLLAGVQISDISRIGLVSKGQQDLEPQGLRNPHQRHAVCFGERHQREIGTGPGNRSLRDGGSQSDHRAAGSQA